MLKIKEIKFNFEYNYFLICQVHAFARKVFDPLCFKVELQGKTDKEINHSLILVILKKYFCYLKKIVDQKEGTNFSSSSFL